LDVDNNEEPIT